MNDEFHDHRAEAHDKVGRLKVIEVLSRAAHDVVERLTEYRALQPVLPQDPQPSGGKR